MDEKVSKKQLNAMILLFIIGISLLFGGGSAAKEDSWVSVLLGVFFIVPICRMYCRILKEYPECDFYQIIEKMFGRVLGKLIVIIYVWFMIHSATLTYLNIVDFINFVGLPNTPILVILIVLALLSIFIVKKGINILGGWSIFFLWIVLSLGLGTTIFLVPLYNFQNISPVLSQGFEGVFSGFVSVVGISFSGLIAFAFLRENYSSLEDFLKVFEKSVFMAGMLIFLLSIQNVLVLGVNNNMRAYFPGYECYRRIEIGHSFQRLDSIISVIFVISEFVRANIFIMAAITGIKRLIGAERGYFLVTPVVMACVNLYLIEYQSIMVGGEYAVATWPYYSVALNIFIPFIMLSMILIREIGRKFALK